MATIALIAFLVMMAALAAISVAFFWFFRRNPVYATLRALVQIILVLASYLAAPTVVFHAVLKVDLSPVFRVDADNVLVTTETPLAAFLSILGACVILAAICLFRIQPNPTTK